MESPGSATDAIFQRDQFPWIIQGSQSYWRVDHWKSWDEVQDPWKDLAGQYLKVLLLD